MCLYMAEGISGIMFCYQTNGLITGWVYKQGRGGGRGGGGSTYNRHPTVFPEHPLLNARFCFAKLLAEISANFSKTI